MMFTKSKIYDLLPTIYRQRDLENGSPLKALLEIIADQVILIEKDIDRLYDNWFIETCDEWVVPYIADLLKVKIPFRVSNATYSSRAWVANTIDYRRRKGTLSMLESLGRDVTGWDCKAVEFFERLVTTQNLNHLRLGAPATADLRQIDSLDRLSSTPFDTMCHTADVRHIDKRQGYYNIPNIGLFLWRLLSLPVYDAPAYDHGNGRYTFNQLGYDEPLFNHRHTADFGQSPFAKVSSDISSDETIIGGPIRRIAMYNSPSAYYYSDSPENDEMQDQSKSVQIRVNGSTRNVNDVEICNLTGWKHRPPSGKVAIDPTLGRILFPIGEIPEAVHVTYYYGFSSIMGGGFYSRSSVTGDTPNYKISKNNSPDVYPTINDAINKWIADGRNDALFEILDSESYDEPDTLLLDIPAKTKVLFRSSQQNRCVTRLKGPLKIRGESGSSLTFDGMIFDLLRGDSNTSNILFKILPGDLGSLFFKHSTLVPARGYFDSEFLFSWTDMSTSDKDVLKSFIVKNFEILNWIDVPDVLFEFVSPTVLKVSRSGDSLRPFVTVVRDDVDISTVDISKAELRITYPYHTARNKISYKIQTIYDFVVRVDKGKLGIYLPKVSMLMSAGESGTTSEGNVDGSNNRNDDLTISIESTICGRISISSSEASVRLNNSIVDGKSSNNLSLWCYRCRVENSTLFGQVGVTILELASNTIFSDVITSIRRQIGCVRFCYLPAASQTPRRYHCQPEYFEQSKLAVQDNDDADDGYSSVVPLFTSIIYGDPGYAQLSQQTSRAIAEGADNGSEMGVFNNLYQAQRIGNLRANLEEYLRFGLEAGIFLAS